jgi:hypothetical protein
MRELSMQGHINSHILVHACEHGGSDLEPWKGTRYARQRVPRRTETHVFSYLVDGNIAIRRHWPMKFLARHQQLHCRLKCAKDGKPAPCLQPFGTPRHRPDTQQACGALIQQKCSEGCKVCIMIPIDDVAAGAREQLLAAQATPSAPSVMSPPHHGFFAERLLFQRRTLLPRAAGSKR